VSYSPERVHELSVLYDLYEGVLPPRQREVLALKLHEDLSLFEISERLGISRQACEDALKRGERALLRLEGKIGFLTRIEQEVARARVISERLSGMRCDNWQEVRDTCLKMLIPIANGGETEDGV
jgi:predicted DNA-binding protein YlxM (UPF0122 family)